MNFITAVTAHTSRRTQARKLCRDLDAWMFLDDGTLGEPGNTRRLLQWAQHVDATHLIVLQDDAQPVNGFLEHAYAAIEERPAHLISYYLGTGRPLQDYIARQVAQADANGDRWIDTTRLIWGVAWSTPTQYLPELNAWLAAHPDKPTDTQVGHWTRFNRTPVTHTWPSLADHTDAESLIRQREEPRKAWRVANV